LERLRDVERSKDDRLRDMERELERVVQYERRRGRAQDDRIAELEDEVRANFKRSNVQTFNRSRIHIASKC
jgi:hypothetical protein